MQSLQKNKEYKEDKKKKLSDSKMKVKIEKSKSANSSRKSKLSSWAKVPIWQKKTVKRIKNEK